MIITHAPSGLWPTDTVEDDKVQPSHIVGLPHVFQFEAADVEMLRGPAGPAGEAGPAGATGPAGAAPAGAVLFFAMGAAPAGWLRCNGAAVSRETYAVLFAAIGTAYGVGDGTTTFNLPDLRGEFLRGLDSGRGVDMGRALGSAQGDLVKDHKHTLDVATVTGSSAAYNGRIAGAQEGSGSPWSGVAGQTQVSGGAENRPRNVAMLPCISTGGV